MLFMYVFFLLIYLLAGFLTAQDIPYLWSRGNVDTTINTFIVLVVLLYLWGAFKILTKILRLKREILNEFKARGKETSYSKYKLAGIIALLYVFSSFIERDRVTDMLVTVIVVPYLLLNLRFLLLEKTCYKKEITAVICYISLFTFLGPFLTIIPYYQTAFIMLGAKGLGFIYFSVLVFLQWNVYDRVIRSIAILMCFLGVFYIHTSFYPFYPSILTASISLIFKEVYGVVKILLGLIIYALYGIAFLYAYKEKNKGTEY